MRGADSGKGRSPCVFPFEDLKVCFSLFNLPGPPYSTAVEMAVFRSNLQNVDGDSGFHVMTRQKSPRGRKNSALILSKKEFVLSTY
jgi:hypothetical protein